VDEVRDDLGVGLRDEPVARAFNWSRSSSKFSMMPLCTTATSPPEVCGCALSSVGRRALPARVRDARGASQRTPVGLRGQVGDPRRADQPVELSVSRR